MLAADGRLSSRITVAAVLVAVVTALAVTVAGLMVIRHQQATASKALSTQHLDDQAHRVEDRLRALVATMRSAVDSSLVRSALTDSAGKELYLQPYLNRLAVNGGVPISVHFVDFEGRVFMESAGALPLGDAQDWVAQKVAQGREALRIVGGGEHGSLVYVVPLVYERTGRTEGAVVAHLPMRDLVAYEHALLATVEGSAPSDPSLEAPVRLPSVAVDPPVRLVLREVDSHREAELELTSPPYGVLGASLLLGVGLAVGLSRLAARRTLRDLDRLVGELDRLAGQVAAGAHGSRVAVEGSIEVRSLAVAVNSLLGALEASSKGYQLEREMRLAGIIESSTDAIITLDAAQRIVQFNAAASQIFRIPADAAIGTTVDRFVPPAQRAAHAERMRAFARSTGGAARRMGGARSFEALRADGQPFHAEAMLTAARIDGQDYLTAVIRDVSELVNAEEDRAARRLADAANREKTAFLARMSHELRTPLNAILGFSDLMLRDGGTVDRAGLQRQRLELIVNSSRRLLALINDLLDVSRIELGELDVHVVSTDVGRVAAAAVAELGETANAAGVTLTQAAGDGGALWAMADETRLHQVVSNLVSNAIKYNHAGGSVTVSIGRQDEWVRLRVDDDGFGMDAAQLAGLYQPFNRLGRHHVGEGTGIGLTIVKHLVDGMGGRIDVASEPGAGTRFTVLLRRGAEGAAEALPAAAESKLLPQADVVGDVLYVEDDPVNQVVVTSCLLLRPAVSVRVADDAASALAMVDERLPDLILVDMMLPDMHGQELAARLRERFGARCPPLIAFSANAMAEQIAAAMAAGFERYLVKPAPTSELLDAVDSVLRGVRNGVARPQN